MKLIWRKLTQPRAELHSNELHCKHYVVTLYTMPMMATPLPLTKSKTE